ncbi:MAG: signal peptidase I [Candidatus Thiodiazotropha sp. (ex Epidulcina cf. delphinae)]|nr:signal peptidase I [Candidatus Thiodiazotropha sp. (ex Epidulcina cf. delphinae)]
MKQWLMRHLRENRSFILLVCLMLVFRSAIADWNAVPTGSMKPTILEGDRILVNKMAYDLRLPFTHISLLKHTDPSRGEIIIFDSEVAGKRLVKRVIGLPGDVVAMRDNQLWINGEKLTYQASAASVTETDKIENLLGVEHWVRWLGHDSRLSSFSPVTVPPDHYLVLGDNRDNSADSRVIGFVPRGEIVGRSRHVVLSLNYDNYYLPRADRFLELL